MFLLLLANRKIFAQKKVMVITVVSQTSWSHRADATTQGH